MLKALKIKYQGRELTRLGAFWFYFGGPGFKRCFGSKQEAREYVKYLNTIYLASAPPNQYHQL